MSWIFWPELIITSILVLLLLFGIYYVVRKFVNIPRRIKKLEQTVYKDDEK